MEALHGADAIAPAVSVIEAISGPNARRVTGWATVELDRAASGAANAQDLPDDALLGARCRLVTFGVGEREVLLLEPATEGRIAASLARFGEGPIAEYLIVPHDRFGDLVRDAVEAGIVLSAEAAGPFGRQRLVIGGPPWGAHLCVAQSTGAATIGP